MASYEYRCGACGPFVVACPMGEAPVWATCPECDGASRRLFTPPGVARTPAALAGAIQRADASASEPSVVTRGEGLHA